MTTRAWFDQLVPEVIDLPFGRVLRDRGRAGVYDANHVTAVRASTPDEIAAFDGEVADVLGTELHKVTADPATPQAYEAHLVMEGFALFLEVEMVLTGAPRLERPVPDVTITPIDGEDDWAAYAELVRLDNVEQAARSFGQPWGDGVAEAIADFRRAKSPAVRHWGARVDGELVAFLSSAAGVDGMGLVEHLFTREDHRGEGVALALLAHCVVDAREQGAEEVLIGARVDDTPKDLYRRLGFEPVCLHRMWMR